MNLIRTTAASTVIASAIIGIAGIGNISFARDCATLDPETEIANLIGKHEDGKVLKVEEAVDANGCTELKIRILIDGTIKAITIPNQTGA